MPNRKTLTKYLRTSDIAKAVGVHPNTVRLYEEWGFLPPIPRSKSGYRQFTPFHKEQMRLARIALQWPYPGGKAIVVKLVKNGANGNLDVSLEFAYQYLAQVQAEQAHAETAVTILEQWAEGQAVDMGKRPLQISQVAKKLDVSTDKLRNWERNGLLTVPRNPENGYRLYTAVEISRIQVIRVLRQAGYSLTAVLRMLIQFDAGQRDHLREVLDTVDPEEDIYYITDNWLTTLAEVNQRAHAIIQQLQIMIAMFKK